MEKNMNSEYSNNPLTEVALALSMAFFSIMVLSIFALSQKEIKLKDENSLSINSSSPLKEKPKNKRSIIFYFNKNIYDKHFKKLQCIYFCRKNVDLLIECVCVTLIWQINKKEKKVARLESSRISELVLFFNLKKPLVAKRFIKKKK